MDKFCFSFLFFFIFNRVIFDAWDLNKVFFFHLVSQLLSVYKFR